MKKSSFQFSNPHIEEISFTKNKNFEPSKNMDTHISTEVNRSENNSNTADVTLCIDLGSNKQPFCLNLKMTAKFTWDETIEDVENYLKVNASALLMSYARPIIAFLTAQAGYPALHMPFVNFTESVEVIQD